MRVELPKAMYQGRFQEVNAEAVAEHRANQGPLTTLFVGAPILLLNHRGRGAGRRTHLPSPLRATRPPTSS